MQATINIDDAILQVLSEYNTGIIVSDLARELWQRYPSIDSSVLIVGKHCKALAEAKRLRRYVGYGPASRAGDVLVKANQKGRC